MPIVFHTIIFLSYAAISVAVAVVLPQNLPGLDPATATIAAAVVFIACGLLHEAFVRFDDRRDLLAEVVALRDTQDNIIDELARARGEARGLYDALQRPGGKNKKQPDIGEVIAEVKVLEKLVKQLSAKRLARPAIPDSAADDGEADVHAPEPRIATGLDPEAILDRVRQGLNSGRVDLFLQPIVTLPQRKVRHFECFSRIRVGDDLMLVPEQYIGLAERAGLIGAIDNMLLFRCVQLVRKCQARKRNVAFFCNISAHSLTDKPFLNDFTEFLALNQNLAPNIVFELTQACVNHVDEDVIHKLQRLASLGFRFSLDQVAHLDMDFAALARHRVKFIKVDASVLLSQIRNPRPGFNLRELKAELNRNAIDLIAEKIESEQALVEILDYPVSFGQGFLFGEPRLSRDDF